MQIIDSPYLTADEAAAYLRYKTAHAFRQAVTTHRIPHKRRGRRLIFLRADLDLFINGGASDARRGRGRRAKRR